MTYPPLNAIEIYQHDASQCHHKSQKTCKLKYVMMDIWMEGQIESPVYWSAVTRSGGKCHQQISQLTRYDP